MLIKPITYIDYNGKERTEQFCFNLTKAEITEMELGINGGLSEKIKRIIESEDQASIVELFKDLILKSYGEKSLDGKKFIKSKELSDGFAQTEAYSDLFMELATDSEKAAEFVNGIIPKNMDAVNVASGTKVIPMNE